MYRWLSVAGLSALLAAVMTGQVLSAGETAPRGDVCTPGSRLGDGRLQPFDLHFVVLVDPADLGTAGRRARIPTRASRHRSPIDGSWIDGEQWFEHETQLINRSFVAQGGSAVCEGRDCLRFRHVGHTFLEDISPAACPELYAFVDPDEPDETQTPEGFGDRLRVAIASCKDPSVFRPGAINVFIFDTANWDEATGEVDRRTVNSWGFEHEGRAAVFLDHTRVFTADRAKAGAVEEHEIGHVFGLRHVCDPGATSLTSNNPMQAYCGVRGGRNRTAGFSRLTYDAKGRLRVNQIERMIERARRLQMRWLGC